MAFVLQSAEGQKSQGSQVLQGKRPWGKGTKDLLGKILGGKRPGCKRPGGK